MLHHVQTGHENEYHVVNKAMRSKATDAPQRLPLSCDRLAADLIISNLLSLSSVENPQLQLVFEETEPSYFLPKRKYSLANVLNQMYDETRKRVQNELNSSPDERRVSIRRPIWLSHIIQINILIEFTKKTESR